MAVKLNPSAHPAAPTNSQKKGQYGAIPEDLKNFDSLPDSAHVRQPVVEGLYACSGATVWRMAKAGRIPKPRNFCGRITAWNVGELRRALAIV